MAGVDLAGRGWIAGLRGPLLGRALAAFPAEPADPWTPRCTRRVAGLSRSAFAAFAQVMGETAIGYLRWMDLAARLVREQSSPLSRVAERSGYRSEAALNQAFRRAHGLSPGVRAPGQDIPRARGNRRHPPDVRGGGSSSPAAPKHTRDVDARR